ncbi:MAG: translational GTPase TypA [Chloroflexota bacterium]|nr:translational GTPase TypA [Chloroflexota bacterium]
MTIESKNIRNIAIIAHVDHGKTTLVDAMLKQSNAFKPSQKITNLVMDSNPLERERGITILAKNTAIDYKDTKINIIDTPGHSDFGGEVERVINMTDGCLLVVDAADGPMPQTRYVLNKALEKGLVPIVVINKIDSPNARIDFVIEKVNDLFLDLATNSEQLDFPVIFASARNGYSKSSLDSDEQSMETLFDTIVNHVPSPKGDPNASLQILVTSLAYDDHLGQMAIGRISNGTLSQGELITRVSSGGENINARAGRIYVFDGLERVETSTAQVGEIVSISGFDEISIGDTISSADDPQALPKITVDPPTVRMSFSVNTSPLSGQDGKRGTSREIRARLAKEVQTNVSLVVQNGSSADEFVVAGRGELHLAVLIETMRREGFEMEVSKPQAIAKHIDGIEHEPYEMLYLETREDFIGILTENLSSRLAKMVNMDADGKGNVRMDFQIPTRGLIGFNSFFVKSTKGQGVMTNIFKDYRPISGSINKVRSGVLVSSEKGVCVPYGIRNAQGRGSTFVQPGQTVYEGMIVGANSRQDDINLNICKEKKLTNVRAAGSDDAIKLTPPVQMTLEECLDFIEDDELVEITPSTIRLRKKALLGSERHRLSRSKSKENR